MLEYELSPDDINKHAKMDTEKTTRSLPYILLFLLLLFTPPPPPSFYFLIN